MPIEVFLTSGILTGILTSLAHSWVHGIRQEYRNHQERKRLRTGLAKRLSEHHGVPYEEIKFGKHRLEGSSAAHELCTDDHPCAHRGWQNGMVHAEFYIERAKLERLEKERARWEAEEWQEIPWPRAEDIPSPRAEETWESDRFSGLLCGYRTPSSFPELSTPVGPGADESTFTQREPVFVGRRGARSRRDYRSSNSFPGLRTPVGSSVDFTAENIGYRRPNSFPGLRTPVGSSVDLTADSTSIPREPTSVGR